MRRAPWSLLAALLIAGAGRLAASVPAGFTDALVVSVSSPTALAFTPDGRLLVTSQFGQLSVVQGGVAETALSFAGSDLCSDFERGLLGLAVDPAFASNHFIYLYYSYNKFHNGCPANTGTSPVNRVSRFTLPDTNVIDPSSELVLLDNMPSPNGNHNAGDVQFGRDGYLYVTIGDGGCDWAGDSGCAGQNDGSRDQHVLTGKVLRITAAGAIPSGNPFQGAGTARCNITGRTTAGNKCQETFAWGLRNPFRLGFDSNAAGSRFFINDVGQDLWEEIDLAAAGTDYGWACREGSHVNPLSGAACVPPPVAAVDPIFEYPHGGPPFVGTTMTACGSVTGGAFVPNGLWLGYDGVYLFGDYVCGAIFRLNNAGGGGPYLAADFAPNIGAGGPVAMRFGPFGATRALYYTTYDGGGQVRRISFNNPTGNNPPTAQASASPRYGATVPLAVNFDATGSSDPDVANTLTYFWDFGDGTPETSTGNAMTSHTYNTPGVFTATLRARDNNFAFSEPVSLEIQPGNTPPAPAISIPAPGDSFFVGQQLLFTGGASDGQDGNLPGSGLSWQVLLHHNGHTHPYLAPTTGASVSLIAPAPEDLAATDGSYLEIYLMATDSQGLQTTIEQNLQPAKVTLSLASDPSGLKLKVNGSEVTAPASFTSWRSYGLALEAPTQPGPGGASYASCSWSDGGAASHSVTTPATPATYTAKFVPLPATGLSLFTVSPCRLVDTRSGAPLLAGDTRTLLLSGSCGVPATAKAVIVNLTAISPGSAGNLRLFPGGCGPSPPTALSFAAGQTRANNALVLLNSSGQASVYGSFPSGSTHVVVDVSGYFE